MGNGRERRVSQDQHCVKNASSSDATHAYAGLVEGHHDSRGISIPGHNNSNNTGLGLGYSDASGFVIGLNDGSRCRSRVGSHSSGRAVYEP